MGEHSSFVDGQLSHSGVAKVFYPHQIPTAFRKSVGQTFTVIYSAHTFNGILIEQASSELEKYYDIRFVDLSPSEKEFLHQEIETYGVSPRWTRKYPRIDLAAAEGKCVVPSQCSLRYHEAEFALLIKNFTLGGLRVETILSQIPNIRIGQHVHFDLQLSNNEVLRGFEGEVRNIALQTRNDSGDIHSVQTLGLKVTNPYQAEEAKYKKMIKDYCLYLKKMNSEDNMLRDFEFEETSNS